jgi:hypothetical protein
VAIYEWLLVAILLTPIGDYSILLMAILLMVIDAYFINGY